MLLANRVSDTAPAPAVDPAGQGEPLALPAAWTPPARPPLPVVASVVPIVGAVGLWLVTGSILSLWLAALGPLIAVATMADAARTARRDRRRHRADADRARADVLRQVAVRHDAERRRAWARHPDAAAMLSRDDDIWRAPADSAGLLVIGEGARASTVRVTGGDGDPESAAVRAQASRVTHAPLTVTAARGVVVVGQVVVAAAVHRALALQMCLSAPPGEVSVVRTSPGGAAWADALPHRGTGGARVLAVVEPGEQVPPDADLVIARRLPGEPLPPRCGAVLTVRSLDDATLEEHGESTDVRVEAIGVDQALAVAKMLAERAEHVLGLRRSDEGPLALADVVLDDRAPGRGALAAAVGLEGHDPAVVDLVADGPHAIVAGVTGSGKSELLITWIVSLCRTHTADEVTFLLADFKGGTAFDGLAGVPHVTGVLTDLDGAGARRAIESLRAEVRRRESAIAAAGARDILDPRVAMPRLVVVVDEFAALLGDHPELHAVFTDLAARGRALGIHLVLGTQRAAGVIRDSLLANCPLRISLRVTDAADSRALLGTDDAARLPGGPHGRGAAFIRRAGDARPRAARIALSDAADVAAAVARAGDAAPRRAWLPALPRVLTLAEARSRADAREAMVLGLVDEPALQRQRIVGVSTVDRGLLVTGGAGSGLTAAIDLVAAQAPGAVIRVPADPEGLWDAVAALADDAPAAGTVVCIDDVDAIATRLPPDHAQMTIERLEDLLRRAGEAGILVVASSHRLTGPVARLVDLFPRRLRLPFASRSEHIAAGGEPADFDADAPPGRGVLDGLPLQLALASAAPRRPRTPPEAWHPAGRLTGFATRRSPAARAAMSEWERRGVRVIPLDAYAADPSPTADSRVVVVGEPDDWQRHWRLLADVRGDHDLVVDTSCAGEYRLLAGTRDLPPYCDPGRGRAWLISAGAGAVRIVLPVDEVRPNRRSPAP